ncbi:Erythropoietin Receptor [Manis pentadactyla]|nr:Erythropoietin Receptor [Manis pentadactyla]
MLTPRLPPQMPMLRHRVVEDQGLSQGKSSGGCQGFCEARGAPLEGRAGQGESARLCRGERLVCPALAQAAMPTVSASELIVDEMYLPL